MFEVRETDFMTDVFAIAIGSTLFVTTMHRHWPGLADAIARWTIGDLVDNQFVLDESILLDESIAVGGPLVWMMPERRESRDRWAAEASSPVRLGWINGDVEKLSALI